MDNSIVRLTARLDFSKTGDDLKKLERQLNAKGMNIKLVLKPALDQKKLRQTISSSLQELSEWALPAQSYMQAVQTFQQLFYSVNELGGALTGVSAAIEISDRQLKRIGDTALQLSQNLGVSADSLLKLTGLRKSLAKSMDNTYMFSPAFKPDRKQKANSNILDFFKDVGDVVSSVTDKMDTIQSFFENIEKLNLSKTLDWLTPDGAGAAAIT